MNAQPATPDSPDRSLRRPVASAFALWVAVLAALAPALRGTPAVGTVATTDLVAPVDLAVTPWVHREAIVDSGGRLLPAVARLDAGAVDAAELEFNVGFARARVAFVDALERAFGERVIDERKIESLRFQSFRSEFVGDHPEFPVGYVLAGAWARGDDGEVMRARMAGVLRQTMTRHLIGSMPRAATVFVVAVPQDAVVRAWSDASPALVRVTEGADVVSLAAARNELWRSLGVGERFAGGFLETLVRENIRYDARLTALFLHERLGGALEGRFVGRGEAIVRRGERIDMMAADALLQLDRLGLAPLTPVPVAEPSRVEVVATQAPPVPTPAAAPARAVVVAELPPAPVETAPLGRWMIAVAAAGLLMAGLGFWTWVRLRRLREVAGAALVMRDRGEAGSLRELVAPHLAREIAVRGTEALFTQRQALLHNEAEASERVAEIETRVASLQPAIQERMRSYERRIKALERELQER